MFVGLLLAQTLVGLAVATVAMLAFVADPFTNPDLAGVAVYGGGVAGVAVIAAIVSLPALVLLVLGRRKRVAAVVLLGLAVVFVAARHSKIDPGTVGAVGTFLATAVVAWRDGSAIVVTETIYTLLAPGRAEPAAERRFRSPFREQVCNGFQ